jgi:hypothetical protein
MHGSGLGIRPCWLPARDAVTVPGVAPGLLSRSPDDEHRGHKRRKRLVVSGSGPGLFEDTMENVYGLVVGVVLLFPWSLVGIMVAGSVWARVKPSGRVRDRR